MKILDRYILTQFLTSFLGAFSILVLIFVFHTIFTYIGGLAGRGSELWIIGKFLTYFIPQLIPIIIPLAVIISSTMTFGAFAENYEFAATKTSDISLMRMTLPLVVLMALLSISAFFLTNNVIPVAYREVYMLRPNIARVKPAVAISEGVFPNIGEGISIKVARKSEDNDQFLHNALIHKKTPDRVNRTVIFAKKGELKTAETNNNFLRLILKDGTYYKDIKTNNYEAQERLPFAKVRFQKYIINLDLSHLNNVDFNEKTDAITYRIMNVGQLGYAIDLLRTDFKQNITDYGNDMFCRTSSYIVLSSAEETKTTQPKTKAQEATSISQLLNVLPNNKKPVLLEMVMNNNQTQLNDVEYRQNDLGCRCKLMNLHILNLSNKFVLTITCFVLFFVAAPLGAFIRRRDIDLPLIVVVMVFLVYYFIGMLMKNIAENNTIDPVLVPWIPTLILLSFGMYPTTRIATDKEVFHFPFTNKILRFVEGKMKQLKSKKTT